MEKPRSLQFYVRKTNKDLIEIVEAFSIDKVKIGFRTFDTSKDKNARVTSSVDFYLSIPEFDLLCHDLLSGNISATLQKGGKVDPMYKGSDRDGKTYSRVLAFGKSNKGIFLNAYEGPGRKNDTGAVMPLFKLNDAPSKVSIALGTSEIKMFAIQGKRACDYYYANNFGRNG